MNRKELFWISITIFLTIITWLLVDIYRIKTRSSSDMGLQNLQIVDFKVDTKMLKVLKEKTP